MSIKIEVLIKFLQDINVRNKYENNRNEGVEFESFCPLNSLKPNCLTWIRSSKNIEIDRLNSISNIILMAEYGEHISEADFPIIYVENVHRTFFKSVAFFFKELDPENHDPQICATATVETKEIGENVFIGHHTYIGKEVKIGNNVKIYNNVTIQGKCEIGDYSVIESGTTIGACGFGHYTDIDGTPVCVPHFGGVRIGRYVKIGANNTISRGCLGDTVIEDYVQTDNLCHIAHNDYIKRGAMLTANTVISGSTEVGENVWTAPGTLLNNSIHVGDNSFLGLGTVATKDVPAGKVVAGVPFKVLRDRGDE